LKKNAIFDIVHGGPIWLDPESELQFMSVDTLAHSVLTLVQQGVRNECLNLCGRGVVKLREVIDWTGNDVAVQPGSPRVRYDVNISKVSRLIDIPPTHETVKAFVAEQAGRGLVRSR
jgi:hypothetical protein